MKLISVFIFSVLFIFSFHPAKADEVFECTRINLGLSGFSSKSIAESWYPEFFSISINDKEVKSNFFGEGEVKKNKSNGRLSIEFHSEDKFGSHKLKFERFKNGKATLQLLYQAGYRGVDPSSYKCGPTLAGVSIANSFSSASDLEVCKYFFGVLGTDYENLMEIDVDLKDEDGNSISEAWRPEAEKRWGKGFKRTKRKWCNHLIIKDDKARNSKKTGSNAGENELSDNLVKLSNATICQRATRFGEWEVRPLFTEYVQEAKRRGLSCGVDKTLASTETNSKYARPDDVQEIVLTSPTSDVWINLETGEAMMKSGSKWFYRIVDDIKAGQKIVIAIASFDEKPDINDIEVFSSSFVDAAIKLDKGVESLLFNISDQLKNEAEKSWYFLYLKSEDGSEAKFSLKLKD